MIELAKNKIIIGFIIMILGLGYIDSMNIKKYEQLSQGEEKELIVMNEITSQK